MASSERTPDRVASSSVNVAGSTSSTLSKRTTPAPVRWVPPGRTRGRSQRRKATVTDPSAMPSAVARLISTVRSWQLPHVGPAASWEGRPRAGSGAAGVLPRPAAPDGRPPTRPGRGGTPPAGRLARRGARGPHPLAGAPALAAGAARAEPADGGPGAARGARGPPVRRLRRPGPPLAAAAVAVPLLGGAERSRRRRAERAPGACPRVAGAAGDGARPPGLGARPRRRHRRAGGRGRGPRRPHEAGGPPARRGADGVRLGPVAAGQGGSAW